ncbi:MAG: Cd(II)/Pb(II)-responsive transcriptional regulator [Hahellaceae bacterium]|nr:Cd(II)/Pb(II)-responsive transcriptional regulator [Hahellaceae bacterium]
MKIGELAKRINCPVETIRYWEKEGLVPTPSRSDGNYRVYREADLERLLFIRNCRTLDMSLEEIRLLLAMRDHPKDDCHEINDLIDEHIQHVEARIHALQSLSTQLRTLRQNCGDHREVNQCGIIEGLSCQNIAEVESEAPTHLTGLHRH